VPVSGSPLEFYVDLSLGRTVAETLRDHGLDVRSEIEVFGHRPYGVPDVEWLERAGREGWIVLSKDKRLRHDRDQQAMMIEHDVKAFVLTSGNLKHLNRRLASWRTWNESGVQLSRRPSASTPCTRAASKGCGRCECADCFVQRLGAIDVLRAAIERAQRRGAALRRSLLERAFRGELVPQDPSDEPASVLLDRIRLGRRLST